MSKKLEIPKLDPGKDGSFLVKIYFEKGETRSYRYKDERTARGFAGGVFKQDTVIKVQIWEDVQGFPVLRKELK